MMLATLLLSVNNSLCYPLISRESECSDHYIAVSLDIVDKVKIHHFRLYASQWRRVPVLSAVEYKTPHKT